MAYSGNNRANPNAVANRLEPRPPLPLDSHKPKLCNRPKSQPLRISGNVSRLGTLSFQPSMTAAAIMAAHTKASGQLLRTKCIGWRPPRGEKAFRREQWTSLLRSSTTRGEADYLATQNIGDRSEFAVGVGADQLDGPNAHHDNQGQHDGILDRGRAVLAVDELCHTRHELTHGTHLSRKKPRTFTEATGGRIPHPEDCILYRAG